MTHIRKMRFRAPHGRTEVLWVEEQEPREFRVMNVPVWVYGISVGTLVRAGDTNGDILEYNDIIEPSPGATIRFIVPDAGPEAGALYLSVIRPRARARGVELGPATFFDPLIVAVHVHDRSTWNTSAADFFNELVDERIIEQWEIGDPDECTEDHQGDGASDATGSELLHPQATTDRSKYYRL